MKVILETTKEKNILSYSYITMIHTKPIIPKKCQY